MWLIPCSRRTSRVRSASSCVTREREAAPKMTRVLSWPVRPNGRVGIGISLILRGGDGERGTDERDVLEEVRAIREASLARLHLPETVADVGDGDELEGQHERRQ